MLQAKTKIVRWLGVFGQSRVPKRWDSDNEQRLFFVLQPRARRCANDLDSFWDGWQSDMGHRRTMISSYDFNKDT